MITTMKALIQGILSNRHLAAVTPATLRKATLEFPEQGDIWGAGDAKVYVTEVDGDCVTLVNDNGFEVWCTRDEFTTYMSRAWGNQELDVAQDCVA